MWKKTDKWRPARVGTASGGGGVEDSETGALGFAKSQFAHREKLASDLAALVGVAVPKVVLDRVNGGAGRPEEGWVWPARTRSGHAKPNSIYGQHLKALQASGVRPFVLYSLRHTFLTRLGESGCDAWTLARIAGHSSVAVSARYVHPSEDTVLAAISRLGGTRIGQSEDLQLSGGAGKLLTSNVE